MLSLKEGESFCRARTMDLYTEGDTRVGGKRRRWRMLHRLQEGFCPREPLISAHYYRSLRFCRWLHPLGAIVPDRSFSFSVTIEGKVVEVGGCAIWSTTNPFYYLQKWHAVANGRVSFLEVQRMTTKLDTSLRENPYQVQLTILWLISMWNASWDENLSECLRHSWGDPGPTKLILTSEVLSSTGGDTLLLPLNPVSLRTVYEKFFADCPVPPSKKLSLDVKNPVSREALTKFWCSLVVGFPWMPKDNW